MSPAAATAPAEGKQERGLAPPTSTGEDGSSHHVPAGGHAIAARLYDAHGEDRAVEIDGEPPRLESDQLLWIDVLGHDQADIEAAGRALDLDPATIAALCDPGVPVRLRRYDSYIHLGLRSVEPSGPEAARAGPQAAVRDGTLRDGAVNVIGLDLILARNAVMTVHDGPIRAFERFRDEIAGATKVGRLDAASFTAALIDSVLEGFLEMVEDVERRVDLLDQQALRARSATAIVAELVVLRSRVALLRRALTPNRPAFAAMARPDFELHEALGRPWPGLLDRLDATLAAVETSRELLIGTFDIVMTGAAQRTNDTVKVLTILSAVLLPANTIAAILGMGFQIPFYSNPTNFLWVLAGMAVLAVGTLVVAIRRDRG